MRPNLGPEGSCIAFEVRVALVTLSWGQRPMGLELRLQHLVVDQDRASCLILQLRALAPEPSTGHSVRASAPREKSKLVPSPLPTTLSVLSPWISEVTPTRPCWHAASPQLL